MFARMSTITSAVALLAGTMLAGPRGHADEQPVGVVEFDTLHKELTAVKELWQTIPWQISLVDARVLAAKEKKPIYMLCRAGHPLGCV